jgi:hypothetical protein
MKLYICHTHLEDSKVGYAFLPSSVSSNVSTQLRH